MKKTAAVPQAMMFFHPDGFVPAFEHATSFAGKEGHVGTMLDVTNACINTGAGDAPWEIYATTMSAEYVGRTRGGNKVILVAHGVGPMSTREGVLAAYSYEFRDKTRNRDGGRISQEEFWKLEGGAYGEVQVVDLAAYIASHKYPFGVALRPSQIVSKGPISDFARARLGPQWGKYLDAHVRIAKEWQREEGRGEVSDPFILHLNDASGLPYEHREVEDGLAFAHLLSIGQLCNVSHDDGMGGHYQSLLRDIHGHGWSDGTRFVGVRSKELATGFHPGVRDLDATVWKHRDRLMLPNPGGKDIKGRFYRILPVAKNVWFTMYPHKGHAMGTGEAEFKVTSRKAIGEPMMFKTKVQGYYGFFRYDMQAVRRLAPVGANAFAWVGEPGIEGTNAEYHVAMVQFYHVEVDTSQRLMRPQQLQNDLPLMLELASK